MISSKYIQIANSILIEYEYCNSILDKGKHVRTSSSVVDYSISNSKTNCLYCINNDTDIANNIKELSNYCISISETNNKFALNKDAQNNINYFDVAKDSSHNFLSKNNIKNYKEKLSDNKLIFDKVRIYFSSSFVFENEGYVLEISTRLKNSSKLIIGSYRIGKMDMVNLIGNPFLIGEKLYNKYIEFYVPSVEQMCNGENPDIENYYTSGFSIKANPVINIAFYNVYKTNYEYVYLEDKNRIKFETYDTHLLIDANIDYRDVYANVYAKIEEVDDYFKLQGAVQNTKYSFSDYIAALPGNIDAYILMHDISVSELVDNEWIITTHNVITQQTDFEEPILFRPVLKYSNSVGCVIDYSLRIYYQGDNTQIIKRATYQDFNYLKYGKKMIKIDLGTNPIQVNVYNKIDPTKTATINFSFNDTLTLNNGKSISQQIITKPYYVTSFKDKVNIKASISPVQIKNDKIEFQTNKKINLLEKKARTLSLNETIYKQGDLVLKIAPFDNYYMFTIYSELNVEDVPVDLSSQNDYYLSFKDDKTEVHVKNVDDVNSVHPASGQILFKISKEDSEKILNMKNDTFYLTSCIEINESKSDETVLFSGKFCEYNKANITYLQDEINTLKDDYKELDKTTNNTIESLNNKISELNNSLSKANSDYQILESKYNELKLSIESVTNKPVLDVKQSILKKDVSKKDITLESLGFSKKQCDCVKIK